jgi:hypothetical protein
MRLGSRNKRQGDRRNRQMFFETPEKHPGVEPVFSEKDQAINPHLKRELQPDANGCKTLYQFKCRFP